MAWYEIVLIVSAALFLLSTVGSLLFGDMDFGADLDTGGGFLVSDVISFKGLLHFCIGFSLALTLKQEVTLGSVVMGVIAGIVFVVVLYYIYRFIIGKLPQSMKYTNEIKEMEAEVYFWDENSGIGEVFVTLEGRPVTVALQCPEGTHLVNGQKITVSGTRKLVHLNTNN